MAKATYDLICKHRKELTDEEILQIELQKEAELKGIRRNYLSMNRDYWSLLTGTDAESTKTKRVLKILNKEQKDVKTDLTIATSFYKAKQDSDTFEAIAEMMRENSQMEQEIKNKRIEIREVEDTIRRVQKVVIKLRSEQVTDDQYSKKKIEGERTVECLEKKLDIQIKKFGTITNQNRILREEIDHLLKERNTFNTLWERAVHHIARGKKILMDLIEQSTVAYNQRDEWVETLNALRNKCYDDYVKDCVEMRELGRIYDHQLKLSNFIEIKEQIRVMIGIEKQVRLKRQKLRLEMEQKSELYISMLSEIQAHFNTSELEDICSKNQWDDNEIVRNVVLISVINDQIEHITRDLKELLKKIGEQQEIWTSRQENQPTTLELLQEKLEQKTQEADDAQATNDAMGEKLQKMYDAISRLFTSTKCDITPFLALLGDNTYIHRYNVMLYLQTLQIQISEIMTVALYKQKTMKKKGQNPKRIVLVIKEEKFFPAPVDTEVYIGHNPCPLCVEQEMVSDVIDTLQFAMSKEEVKDFLVERLALPDGLDRLHSVSLCHLPKSREIIQKRYQ